MVAQRRSLTSPQIPLLMALGLALLMTGLGLAVTRMLSERARIRQKYGEAGLQTLSSRGKPAPDFTLVSLSGKTYRLQDLQGQGVVVNFWATWCPPCKAEMPLLEAAARDLQGQVLFLAVNYAEPEDTVRAFVEDMGGFEAMVILLDPQGEVSRLYGVQALPTTFFVNSQGKIQDVHLGALDASLLTKYLENLVP